MLMTQSYVIAVVKNEKIMCVSVDKTRNVKIAINILEKDEPFAQ